MQLRSGLTKTGDHKYSFEKLEVWQLAMSLSEEVYEMTRLFPEDERFGLTSQMRRSCVSITSNIAEGSSRFSDKDKAKFYQYAFSSSMELLNQIILCQRLRYINEDEYLGFRNEIHHIANKLNGLYRSVIHRVSEPSTEYESKEELPGT